MCGRFTYKLTWEEPVRLYRLTLEQPPRNTQARYNICSTDPIDTIVESDGKRELASMRWAWCRAGGTSPSKTWRRSTRELKP
jgi:putative SOS response-associated peptidase YedK